MPRSEGTILRERSSGLSHEPDGSALDGLRAQRANQSGGSRDSLVERMRRFEHRFIVQEPETSAVTLCQVGGLYCFPVTLICVGMDFTSAPLSLLGRLEGLADEFQMALKEESKLISGSAVLATCNRFEVYAAVEDFHAGVDKISSELSRRAGKEVAESLKVRFGPELVEHLFFVAAGLKSIAIGESEIRGQVRKSIARSRNLGTASAELNDIFDAAISAGRKAALTFSQDKPGRGLIDLAIEAINPHEVLLASALIVGTGSYAKEIVTALRRFGIVEISVHADSARAARFAELNEVDLASSSDLAAELAKHDLAILARGGSEFTVTVSDCQRALALKGTGNPLRLIDMAASNDVDPFASDLPGVELVSLEGLRDQPQIRNGSALEEVEKMLMEEAKSFSRAQSARGFDPIVIAMRGHVERWIELEVESVRKRAGGDTATEVEQSLRRVLNTLLHKPTLKVKDLTLGEDHSEYLRAIRLLFDLEVSGA